MNLDNLNEFQINELIDLRLVTWVDRDLRMRKTFPDWKEPQPTEETLAQAKELYTMARRLVWKKKVVTKLEKSHSGVREVLDYTVEEATNSSKFKELLKLTKEEEYYLGRKHSSERSLFGDKICARTLEEWVARLNSIKYEAEESAYYSREWAKVERKIEEALAALEEEGGAPAVEEQIIKELKKYMLEDDLVGEVSGDSDLVKAIAPDGKVRNFRDPCVEDILEWLEEHQ